MVSSATLRIALGGVALDRVGLDLDPLFAGVGGGGVEDEVDVLARAELVLDVSRGVALLVLDLALGDRRVGADDAERRARQLGEVDGLSDRLARRSRTRRYQPRCE